MALVQEIRECIEQQLNENKKRFVIFPFGDVGVQIADTLETVYNIKPNYIIDNHLCKYNSNIKPISFLDEINCNDYVFFLASINKTIYKELKELLRQYVLEKNIVELKHMWEFSILTPPRLDTIVGKYSYGPICRNHDLIERIGNFCSFADGVDVVANHEMNCLTTHPMIYAGQTYDDAEIEYDYYRNQPWYVEGISPRNTVSKRRRTVIGNDVWLGKNVIITNGAKIGNGVIAGAGAVITKDIPDYAVIAGVPARVLRYRYTEEQIMALNQIQWWNWSDDQIKERYEDFYLPIEEFVKKYCQIP